MLGSMAASWDVMSEQEEMDKRRARLLKPADRLGAPASAPLHSRGFLQGNPRERARRKLPVSSLCPAWEKHIQKNVRLIRTARKTPCKDLSLPVDTLCMAL